MATGGHKEDAMKTATLEGFEFSFDELGDLVRVTVTRRGQVVSEQVVKPMNRLAAFQFEADGLLWRALATVNGKNALVAPPEGTPASVGRQWEFRKATAAVLDPASSPWWLAATAAWNLVQGLVMAVAVCYGLFSTVEPLSFTVVTLLVGGLSFAIDFSRDRAVVRQIRAAWG